MDCSNRQIKYELLGPCIIPHYSYIRALHCLPQLPPVDMYTNGILRIQHLDFLELSAYLPAQEGAKNIQIRSSVDNSILHEVNNYYLIGEQLFTFVIYGTLNNLKAVHILDDVHERVFPDETKIRFFNLYNNKIYLSMTSSNSSAFEELESGQGSNYREVVPGEYKLTIRTNHRIHPITMNINLNPGRIYTIYVTGSLDPSSPVYEQGNILQVVQIVDGNCELNECIWM